MSLTDEYRDMLAELYLLCPDFIYEVDIWPKDAIKCNGWLLSDFDTYHKCPRHYKGQPNPESHEEEFETIASSDETDDDRPF
jgi:hypothetical protein